MHQHWYTNQNLQKDKCLWEETFLALKGGNNWWYLKCLEFLGISSITEVILKSIASSCSLSEEMPGMRMAFSVHLMWNDTI